jgi:hypothetical protein
VIKQQAFEHQCEVHWVNRGVAFVGLPPGDERRIKAAIGILSIHKLLPTPWRVCAVEEADLVIVAPDNPVSRPLLESAIRRTGPITAALVTGADAIPPGCERLVWPMRASGLRNLLLNVEDRLARGNGSAGASSAGGIMTLAPLSRSSLLDLANMLREANEPDSYGSVWIVRGIAPKPLYVAPRMSAFLFEGSLSTLRNLPRHGSLAITRVREQDLPQGAAAKPLIMLQWLVGILLGQKSLLPWIDPEAVYSLRRWPDFAVLKHRLEHQRIATLLGNRAAVIPDIVRLAQVDEHVVNEFLNAASLTGRLVAAGVPQIAAAQPWSNVGNALLQHLRKALGIKPGR